MFTSVPPRQTDFKWLKQYGDVVRVTGPLQNPYLLISDPKALQYIFHTSGYKFPKAKERIPLLRAAFGGGILAAEGEISVVFVSFPYNINIYRPQAKCTRG